MGIFIVATALWLIQRDGELAQLAAPEHDQGAIDLHVKSLLQSRFIWLWAENELVRGDDLVKNGLVLDGDKPVLIRSQSYASSSFDCFLLIFSGWQLDQRVDTYNAKWLKMLEVAGQ